MRAIQTFILRLLIDPAEPNVLRGALQLMPDGNPQPFSDEQALLSLLYLRTNQPSEAIDAAVADTRETKSETRCAEGGLECSPKEQTDGVT